MIFLTVGSEPCDRLVQAFDQWLLDKQYQGELFAQIADGKFQPVNCKYVRFLTPTEYREKFERSRLVVSHAGMGTIITALEMRKPLVVMPRRASLGETRNEHQLATVRHFQRSKLIIVADSEVELGPVLDRVLTSGICGASHQVAASESTNCDPDSTLIDFVRKFVSGDAN